MSKGTTRERIPAAASDEFSAKGFDKTTIRDISAKADVNVAAINYHFRDKQNLYYKVLARWVDDYMEKTGLREGMATLITQEEKLRQCIRTELGYTCRANDPEGRPVADIVNPTVIRVTINVPEMDIPYIR